MAAEPCALRSGKRFATCERCGYKREWGATVMFWRCTSPAGGIQLLKEREADVEAWRKVGTHGRA